MPRSFNSEPEESFWFNFQIINYKKPLGIQYIILFKSCHWSSNIFEIKPIAIWVLVASIATCSIFIIFSRSFLFFSSSSNNSWFSSVFLLSFFYWMLISSKIPEVVTEALGNFFYLLASPVKVFIMYLAMAKQSLSCCFAYFSGSNFFHLRAWKQFISCL